MPAYRCAVHRQTDFCRSFILRRHAATQVGTGTAVYALLLWYLILQLFLVYTYRLRCSAWDVVASRCYGADLIVRLNSREGYGRTGAPRQRRGLLHPVCICEQHQQYSSSRYTWYVRVAHSSTCFHMLLVLFHFRNRRYPPSFYCCTISIQGCVVPRLYVQQHCATC